MNLGIKINEEGFGCLFAQVLGVLSNFPSCAQIREAPFSSLQFLEIILKEFGYLREQFLLLHTYHSMCFLNYS